MKVTCPREGLLKACQLVAVAVPTRSTRPILQNLKAIAEDDRLTLMASDLEIGIRHELRSPTIDEAGEAVLPAGQLLDILRESRDEEMAIEADETRCLIRGASNEFEMPGESPGDFPDIPTFDEEAYHELTAAALRDMVRRTVFAAAREEGSNIKFTAMTGVLWEFDGDAVRLVATDSKRLAWIEGAAADKGGHAPKGQSYVVPAKAMSLLERSLAGLDDEAPVRVCLRSNEVLFHAAGTVIASRLKEGRFPPYRQIMPDKSSARVQILVAPFLSAVRQAAIMADESSRSVVFRFEAGKLTLAAQGAAHGRSRVEMPIGYDGATLEIKFDPNYLIDMLKVLDPADELSLEMTDANRPALFKQKQERKYSYLVMPLS
jgi:DNA polymerase-3 subunit beta